MGRFSGFKFKIEPKSFSTNQAYDAPILVTQSDFSGGINNSRLQTAIDVERELFYSENLYIDIQSQIKTRPAFVNYASVNPESRAQYGMQGFGEYGDYLLMAYGGYIYRCKERLVMDSTTFIYHKEGYDFEIVGECEPNVKVQFLPFHSHTYILDGGKLKRYNNEDLVEEVPNAPVCRFGISYRNRLWVAGNEGFFNDEDDEPCHAYGLYVSGPNDAEDWGKHGLKLGTFFEIDPYEVSTNVRPNQISGMTLYGEAILVFKTGAYDRVYRVDGTTTDSFQMSRVHEGSTCTNPFTATITPLGVFYLSPDGVRAMSDQAAPAELVSSKLSKDALRDINLPDAESVYDSDSGNYIITSSRAVWVFNIYTRGWFFWRPPSEVHCVRSLERGIYFGTTLGSILCLNDEEYREYNEQTDTLDTITSIIETAAYDFGHTSITKYLKNCYMLMELPYSAALKFEFRSSRPSLHGVGTLNQYSIKDKDDDDPYIRELLWNNPNYIWDFDIRTAPALYLEEHYGFDEVDDDEVGTSGWDYEFNSENEDYITQFEKVERLLRPSDPYFSVTFDQAAPDVETKYRQVTYAKRYLSELYANIKTITAYYNNPNYGWDSVRFIWDEDMRLTASEFVKKMYGFDEPPDEYGDIFYGWDIGMPPPDESQFKEWYDRRIAIARGLFNVGEGYEVMSYDSFIGSNSIQIKMPVGLRDTNITLRVTVSGSPVTFQEISFDGAMLRPAP